MRYTEVNEGSMERRYGGNRRQPMDTLAAFEFIKANCMQAYEGDPIYRGVTRGNTPGAKIVDPASAAPRGSANTKSYFGILMDNLPAWRAYPKRSKSLICSTSQRYAQAFGVVHRMFPVDGTAIGICRERDVWDSFHAGDVPRINEALVALGREFLHKELSEVPGEFFAEVELLTEHLDQIGGLERVPDSHILKPLIKMSKRLGTNDLKTILAKIVDPEENDFKLVPIDNFVMIEGEREIWYSGKSVMLPKPLWGQLDHFIHLGLKPDNIAGSD